MKKTHFDKQKNPENLEVASKMYRWPALIVFLAILSNFIYDHRIFFYIIKEYWPVLIFALLYILIGIGLSLRNIIAWWSALVSILPILYISTKNIIDTYPDIGDGCNGTFALLSTSMSILINIYYIVIIFLITRPTVKAVFKKVGNVKNDE